MMAVGTLIILLGVLVLISGGLFIADFGQMWNIDWWHDTFIRTEWYKTAPAVIACGLVLLAVGVLTVMLAKRFRTLLTRVNKTQATVAAVAQSSNNVSVAMQNTVPVQARLVVPEVALEGMRLTAADAVVAVHPVDAATQTLNADLSMEEANLVQSGFEPTTAPLEEEETVEAETENERTYNMSLKAHLIEDSAEGGKLQEYYGELKNELMSYRNVRSRMSWESESFSYGRVQLARWVVRGKGLRLYLAMIPLTIDPKYHTSDASDSKKFSRTPVLIKITGKRALGNAKELIAQMMELYGIQRLETRNVDYRLAPMSVAEMKEKGLIKRR